MLFYLIVSAFGWPDRNTWYVPRVVLEKLRNHLPNLACDLLAFLNFHNITACLDQAIQAGEPLGISLQIIDVYCNYVNFLNTMHLVPSTVTETYLHITYPPRQY